jgi:hypothetical protein
MKEVKHWAIWIASMCLILAGSACEEEPAEVPSSTHDIGVCLYYYGDELIGPEAEKAAALAAQYDLLVLTEKNSNSEVIAGIKKRNRDTTIILYTNATQLANPYNEIVAAENIYPNMQQMFRWIEANHPDWFLRDTEGEFIYPAHPYFESEYYREFWPYLDMFIFMDPATGWADYYASQSAEQIGDIYDGLYSDVAMTYEEVRETVNALDWVHDPGEKGWNQAMIKMLDAAHEAVGRDRFTMYNNGYNLWAVADAYDGRLLEWWVQLDMDEPLGGDIWKMYLDSAQETVKMGKALCVAQYGTSARDRMYGLASFLLIAGDQSYYFFDEGGVDTGSYLAWYPEYEAAIGEPLSDYSFNDGVYRRDFTKGTVLVNPSDVLVSVALDEIHTTLQGVDFQEIKLAARSGAILLRGAKP